MLEMAEVSAMNSDNQESFGELVAKEDEDGIKKEPDVTVKPEPQECAVCVARSGDVHGIYTTRTTCGTSLNDFLCKFTHRDLVTSSSKHVCKSCFDLINIFEQTELEYFKLKETFESIISKNPLFEQTEDCQSNVDKVKIELSEELSFRRGSKDDSEDEPLSLTKKKRHRKVVKRKKKVYSTAKRKPRAKASEKDSWEYPEDVEIPDPESPTICDVKKEASPDRTESLLNNGLDKLFKIEMGDFDDDDNSSNYIPDDISNGEKKRSNFSVGRPRKSKLIPMQKIRKKRERVVHQCDQCDAKYTSIRRLEAHKEKHEDGKPPYICEVCGARYKHKRACDIHVALHKGISDWKCEECNKLFPSKGALQRHNNIHTGKLNYQCDLCGKSFIHTSSFKMHKLSHSGVKPHACDVCGLALMTRSHLKRHKRIHSGEKRHECGVCGKRFSERYNLVAHGKAHEGTPVTPSQLAPRRRLFRCPYCPERFERRYMLERHTAASHGRTLERAPPTPRNTMSKLLKAQAARCGDGAEVTETKEERSPDSRASSAATPHKIQLSSTSTITAGSWSGAYAAEFGLRDYQH